MNLRQLEYFVAVAEEESFTRAADRVGISQSGVSAQIRQLERELGADLFERSARRVILSVAGRAAMGRARAVLAAAEGVGQAVDEVTGLIRGRLVVGMVVGCTVTPLFDALAAFHNEHPGVEISLLEDRSDRLFDAVRAGSVDLALAGTTGPTAQDLRTLTVVSERLIVAVPPGHPLTASPRPPLRDVVGYPVVCMPPGTGVRAAFDDACAAQGLTPTITLQASAANAVADLAARGLAVAVLTESMTAPQHERLLSRPIDDATDPALLVLAWKDTGNPAVHALLRHAGPAFTGSAERQPVKAGR
ncbi:LysR family transcriptional regulator [Streptomyces sp. V1I1]|uniref:LysR family transcriptional regulator n=1 Tax=Streptomyces sp. V1I1 TaxID=3042272 RepID=UPI0027D8C835|nr:LysR family transcriptional regulator [Streptomyces sp. V1I1]